MWRVFRQQRMTLYTMGKYEKDVEPNGNNYS